MNIIAVYQTFCFTRGFLVSPSSNSKICNLIFIALLTTFSRVWGLKPLKYRIHRASWIYWMTTPKQPLWRWYEFLIKKNKIQVVFEIMRERCVPAAISQKKSRKHSIWNDGGIPLFNSEFSLCFKVRQTHECNAILYSFLSPFFTS